MSVLVATATASALLVIRGLGLTRDEWAARSIADGTDWMTLSQAALDVLVTGIVELEPSTFQIACEQSDRKRRGRGWR
jgi:hypothetical protein